MSDLPPHILEKVQHALPPGLMHDLRTPLGHVIGYAELLKELAEDAGDEKYSGYIDKIRSAADHLLVLLEDNFRSDKPTD